MQSFISQQKQQREDAANNAAGDNNRGAAGGQSVDVVEQMVDKAKAWKNKVDELRKKKQAE